MNSHASDERWMQVALMLSRRGLGQVWPNPAVGCVIIKDDRVVGRGWTQPFGRPHAEVHALTQAGPASRGATAYVTLEPCAHHGKSGPCANALVEAGITRVVSAITDPDPRVSGKGYSILRSSGVTVSEGTLKGEAAEANAGFFLKITKQRPLVTLKLASSLDGRIATQTGDSRWITGHEARRSVHMMRAQHDAILVGRNTVAADNPELTVRDMGLRHRSPVRVVLDTNLQISKNARLIQSVDTWPLWLCHVDGCADVSGILGGAVEGITCKLNENNQLDITDVLRKLADRGITRLMVEGGGQVAASFLAANHVDQIVLYSAGLTIGSEGIPNLAAMGLSELKTAPRFKRVQVTAIGNDVVSHWKRETL